MRLNVKLTISSIQHWFSVWHYRITASLFGHVLHHQETTLPDSLVLRIVEQKQFSSAATEWELKHEPVAIQQYIDYQRACSNNHLMVFFLLSESHPYLGASPDGAVYDVQEPFGILEPLHSMQCHACRCL